MEEIYFKIIETRQKIYEETNRILQIDMVEDNPDKFSDLLFRTMFNWRYVFITREAKIGTYKTLWLPSFGQFNFTVDNIKLIMQLKYRSFYRNLITEPSVMIDDR